MKYDPNKLPVLIHDEKGRFVNILKRDEELIRYELYPNSNTDFTKSEEFQARFGEEQLEEITKS